MRRSVRILAVAALVILALTAVAGLGVQLARSRIVEGVRRETALQASGAIESLQKIHLGGLDQWIFVRGVQPDSPVLLMLHGGPGSPLMPVAREFDRELVKHFIVVHWDQRGAGKSYSWNIPEESMTLDQFVSDARLLVEHLRERFGKRKIVLAGSSWGTVLGSHLAARHPDLFYAWVSIGTGVHGARAEAISYDYVLARAKAAGDDEAMETLREIGPPPYDTIFELARQRQLLRKFGGVFHNPEKTSFWARYGWASPEYSLADIARFVLGEYFSARTMVLELAQTNDLLSQVPRIDVPVFFLQGRFDRNCPSALVEEYFAKLQAPRGKQLIWFEQSGHALYREETEKFQQLMIDQVLPLARDGEAWSARVEHRDEATVL